MKFFFGITGASGAQFAAVAVNYLHYAGHDILLCGTKNGRAVFQSETNLVFSSLPGRHFDEDDFSAPVASGSCKIDGAIILPCSMSTLSKIAHGASTNLVTRVADVCLKESRKLILCVRETPLNLIHVENMAACIKAGAVVMPICPALYGGISDLTQVFDAFAGRALAQLGVENNLYAPWGEFK